MPRVAIGPALPDKEMLQREIALARCRYRGAAATRYWSCPPLRCPGRVGPPVLNTRSPKSLAGTCKPSLWPCQARAPGNVFSRPETQGPKLPLSGPFSWWRLKASLNARAKSRVFGKPREISAREDSNLQTDRYERASGSTKARNS
jgi:hypothetical protein